MKTTIHGKIISVHAEDEGVMIANIVGTRVEHRCKLATLSFTG